MRYRIRIFEDRCDKDVSVATSIQVIVPTGLTHPEALEYFTGRVSLEVGRYAAGEALPGPDDPVWKPCQPRRALDRLSSRRKIALRAAVFLASFLAGLTLLIIPWP